MMRIQNLGHTSSAAPTKKAGRSGKAFSLGHSENASEAQENQGAAFVSPLSAFVISEKEETPLEQRRQQQGRSLLSTLKALQRDIMLDQPSPDTLHSLKRQLKEDLSIPSHPKLHNLLQQIELRASVEIAKYGL